MSGGLEEPQALQSVFQPQRHVRWVRKPCAARFPYVIHRIGNKPDAEYVGGFNLFGEKFGDYEQNLVLTFFYRAG